MALNNTLGLVMNSHQRPSENRNFYNFARLYLDEYSNTVGMWCKITIKVELDNFGLHYTVVELGEVEIVEELSREKYRELKVFLPRINK